MCPHTHLLNESCTIALKLLLFQSILVLYFPEQENATIEEARHWLSNQIPSIDKNKDRKISMDEMTPWVVQAKSDQVTAKEGDWAKEFVDMNKDGKITYEEIREYLHKIIE